MSEHPARNLYWQMRHVLSQLNELEWDGEEDTSLQDSWNEGMDIMVRYPELYKDLKKRFVEEAPPWLVK